MCCQSNQQPLTQNQTAQPEPMHNQRLNPEIQPASTARPPPAHLHGVLVANGVFTQEVKLDLVGGNALHVLHLQRVRRRRVVWTCAGVPATGMRARAAACCACAHSARHDAETRGVRRQGVQPCSKGSKEGVLQPTLRVQQPTVSASSSSFSWPARSASLSMKYRAVAICGWMA